MSEFGVCRNAIACRRNGCGLETSITETADGHVLGLRYIGVANCRVCKRSWTYMRTEGRDAEVKKKS